MAQPPVTEKLARLVESLSETDTLDATVEQVIQFARDTVGADEAGLTLIRPKNQRFDTLGQTSQVVWDLDELQHELREGPCVLAATEGRTLWSDDLGADQRFPNWGPAAAERGMHSILSIELHAHNERIGAMNLYGRSYRQFGPDDALTGRVFAYYAAAALAASRTETQLNRALDSRTEIGQAQGILMERFKITGEQAFNVLRRHSQDRNVKVSVIAQELVQSRELES